ncbi:sigma-70 family RNA polymerase sigma factor [Pelagicoccus albus]|nr:sigma-70 family RNA polymerase sigma factor [Pelagicoccus albus]
MFDFRTKPDTPEDTSCDEPISILPHLMERDGPDATQLDPWDKEMTSKQLKDEKPFWSESNVSDLTICLQAIESGDERASEELLPLVYDELRQHAGVRMARESSAHTLQPTALVHEAWLRVVGKGGIRWESRAHFFGAAAEAMRRILIESARRKARLKRGGDLVRVDLNKIDVASASPEEKVLMIDEALEKLKEKDPEQARVVILKFYMSNTNAEVADMLRVSERTVERRWAFAKAWLMDAIKNQQGG